MDDYTSSRKRSRSSSPVPPSSLSAKRQSLDTATGISEQDRQFAKGLKDPVERNQTLNHLLQLSASHDKNYALTGDVVLRELADIAIYDCLGWRKDKEEDHHDDIDDDETIFSSHQTWFQPPTARMRAWQKHCQHQLDPKHTRLSQTQIQTLSVILVILRNLSYVSANHRLLAYDPSILALLIGCLYEGYDAAYGGGGLITEVPTGNPTVGGSSSSISMTLALSALQTLIHLVPHMDVSGQKLLSDKLFYMPSAAASHEGPMVPQQSTFGQTATGNWGMGAVWLAKRLDAKEDMVADVDRDFLLTFTQDQLVVVWSLFSAMTHVLTNTKSPRVVLLLALDLLQELLNPARIGVVGSVPQQDEDGQIPSIRAILAHVPDSILDRLVDFLCIARLGPDSLDYVDPVHNIVTRVTTLKLLMGYDATVDTDIRDRSLDALVALMELDTPRMASRLGRANQQKHVEASRGDKDDEKSSSFVRTQLWDSLVPILSTKAGRNEASMLACQLLRELSKSDDSRVGLMYIQSRLITLASKDHRVAQLVWNDLYPIPVKKESEDAALA